LIAQQLFILPVEKTMLINNFIKKFFKKKSKKNIFILSGGKSIKKIYKKIYNLDISWANSKIFIVDERLIKQEKNLNSTLIKKIFKTKCDIYDVFENKVKNSYITKKIKKNNTLAILGMGEDGHFASIFNNSKKYKSLINPKETPGIYTTEKIGKPFCKRVTMNLSMINLSLKIILVVANKKRLEILKRFIKFPDKKIPIIHLLKNKKKNVYINFKDSILHLDQFEKKYDL
tara:strand:+ start:4588 stop:5280 length:693 start_codon:yes stop_codon:yes gene_type:complete